MTSWSEHEISLLRRAVHEVPSSVEKQERFKQISVIVGTRGKRECYEQYKTMKDAKAQKKTSQSTESRQAAAKEDGTKLDASMDLLDDLLGELGVEEAKASSESKEESSGAKLTEPMTTASHRGPDAHPQQEVRLGKGMLRQTSNEAKHSSSLGDMDDNAASTSALGNSEAGRATSTSCEGKSEGKSEGKHDEGSRGAVKGGGWFGDDDGSGGGVAGSGGGVAGGGGKAVAAVSRAAVLTAEAANGLKDLFFNDRKKVFSEAWKKQGLYFASSAPGSGRSGRGRAVSAQGQQAGTLGYGLEQRSGGPCGVLASCNAFVLSELLFPPPSSSPPSPSSDSGADGGAVFGWRNPPPATQRTALLRSIAAMLLLASSEETPTTAGSGGGSSGSSGSGGGRRVVVCLPLSAAAGLGGGGGSSSLGQPLFRSGTYSTDGFTEQTVTVAVSVPLTSSSASLGREGEGVNGGGGGASAQFLSAVATLCRWLDPHLPSFEEPSGCGALLLLTSVVLTRGLANVRQDMDQGFAGEVRTLLDRHGYMSQEGVNLLLLGRAHSNVFDFEKVLSDDTGLSSDAVTLKGVPRRGKVGFLSLQEAFGYFEVGAHFKEPEVPVWVVYSESHYSILFGTIKQRALVGRDKGDDPADVEVFYWDMLAKQDQEIKLTLVAKHDEELPDNDDDSALIPPLDLVCRTKWAGRLVDWNGYEPIL